MMEAELAVEVTGDGPPLLLIHGLGATGNVWGPQVPALSRLFTVIRPDLRGAGRSTSFGEVSVPAHVDDLVGLLDERGHDAVDVVGWSYGSMVAQLLAVGHPERVRSLALLGPLAEAPAPAKAALQKRAEAARHGGLVDIADATVLNGTSAATRSARPEVAAFVRELVMRQDPEGYARICESIAAASAAPAADIKCPTLLLSGDEDNTSPPASVHALAEAIGGSELQLLSRCGHWLTLERPLEVTDALVNFSFRKASR